MKVFSRIWLSEMRAPLEGIGSVSPYPPSLWVALDVLGQLQLTLETACFEITICPSASGDLWCHLWVWEGEGRSAVLW